MLGDFIQGFFLYSVVQSNFEVDPSFGHLGPIGDGDGAEFAVGHYGEGVVKGADPSAAEGNVLDNTLEFVRGNPVADEEGFVRYDDEAGKEVGSRVLGSQGKDQAP